MKNLIFSLLFLSAIYVSESRSVVDGSYYVEIDVKKDILKEVSGLFDEATHAIETLTKSGKTELTNGLEKSIKFIESMNEKVKTLKPTTEPGKLLIKMVEKLVEQGVTLLSNDLKKAEGKPVTGKTGAEAKPAFLKAVGDVVDESITAFDTLQKGDKKTLLDALNKIMGVAKQIQTALKTLHPTTTIGKAIFSGIEKIVVQIEGFIQLDIKFLSGKFYEETVKDDLKKQVDNLKKQAQEAIEKLKGQGKTTLADGIKKMETHLVDLEAQLEKLNPQTEVGKVILKTLEGLVKAAETKLEQEIKKLSGSYYVDIDVKKEILKQVSSLFDEADHAIETLMKKSKSELINGLEKSIKFIESMNEKVKTLKPTTEMGKLLVKMVEKLAEQGVDMLSNDLKKAEGKPVTGKTDAEVRTAFLKAVGDIVDEAKAAMEKLKTGDKKVLVDALTKVMAVAKQIQTELKTLHPSTTVGKAIFVGVEKLITQIEGIVEHDIKTLSGTH